MSVFDKLTLAAAIALFAWLAVASPSVTALRPLAVTLHEAAGQ